MAALATFNDKRLVVGGGVALCYLKSRFRFLRFTELVLMCMRACCVQLWFEQFICGYTIKFNECAFAYMHVPGTGCWLKTNGKGDKNRFQAQCTGYKWKCKCISMQTNGFHNDAEVRF